MFWLGLLRALTSSAQTPMRHGFTEEGSNSLIELAAVLAAVLPLNRLGARLDERVECPNRPAGRGSETESVLADLEDSPLGWIGGIGPVGVRSLGSGSTADWTTELCSTLWRGSADDPLVLLRSIEEKGNQ